MNNLGRSPETYRFRLGSRPIVPFGMPLFPISSGILETHSLLSGQCKTASNRHCFKGVFRRSTASLSGRWDRNVQVNLDHKNLTFRTQPYHRLIDICNSIFSNVRFILGDILRDISQDLGDILHELSFSKYAQTGHLGGHLGGHIT